MAFLQQMMRLFVTSGVDSLLGINGFPKLISCIVTEMSFLAGMVVQVSFMSRFKEVYTKASFSLYLWGIKVVMPISHFVQRLRARNMVENCTPGTQERLSEESLRLYVGIDPTAPSLHIGSLAILMLLRQFQLAGHRPILLLGRATAMIGDPSFKGEERPLISQEAIIAHQVALEKQIRQLLEVSGAQGIQLISNHEWWDQMNIQAFLREIGKHFSVNEMKGKASVKDRLKGGISFAEFAYPILQAHDFFHLYHHYGVEMQVGGGDQWGNITSGIGLLRRRSQAKAYGLTVPLITQKNGLKFGKTESGNVWLDPKKTTSYQFYQYLFNRDDNQAYRLLKQVTLTPLEEIEALAAQHEAKAHKRLLQRKLAYAATTFVHGERAAQDAVRINDVLFGTVSPKMLTTLDEGIFEKGLAEMPRIEVEPQALSTCLSLAVFLSHTTGLQIFSSKRKAWEMILSGGVRINKVLYRDPATKLPAVWLKEKYLLIQKGKRTHYLIVKKGASLP